MIEKSTVLPSSCSCPEYVPGRIVALLEPLLPPPLEPLGLPHALKAQARRTAVTAAKTIEVSFFIKHSLIKKILTRSDKAMLRVRELVNSLTQCTMGNFFLGGAFRLLHIGNNRLSSTYLTQFPNLCYIVVPRIECGFSHVRAVHGMMQNRGQLLWKVIQ